MVKSVLRGLTLAAIVPVLAAMPASASSIYFEDFGSQPTDLYISNFEGGVVNPGLACGVDACATFEKQGHRDFMNITVNPSQNPGFYTNVDVSQVDLGTPGSTGPYTPSHGHPVVMHAKVKWSANYDLAGAGDAQGTSGIVLWNPDFGTPYGGPGLSYDQIGFTWTSQDVIGGAIAGFTATSFIDLYPVEISRPSSPINLNQWFNVTMVWSENAEGVQRVTYFADGQLLGSHVLPTALENLGLEIWNDNQEPVFCEEGICNSSPNPNQPQSFYVDYVRIVQH